MAFQRCEVKFFPCLNFLCRVAGQRIYLQGPEEHAFCWIMVCYQVPCVISSWAWTALCNVMWDGALVLMCKQNIFFQVASCKIYITSIDSFNTLFQIRLNVLASTTGEAWAWEIQSAGAMEFTRWGYVQHCPISELCSFEALVILFVACMLTLIVSRSTCPTWTLGRITQQDPFFARTKYAVPHWTRSSWSAVSVCVSSFVEVCICLPQAVHGLGILLWHSASNVMCMFLHEQGDPTIKAGLALATTHTEALPVGRWAIPFQPLIWEKAWVPP